MFDISGVVLRTAIRSMLGDFTIRHVPERSGIELVQNPGQQEQVEFMSYPELAEKFAELINGQDTG